MATKLPKLTTPTQKGETILRIDARELIINDDANGRRYHNDGIEDLVQQLLNDGQQIHPIIVRRATNDPSKLAVVLGFRRAKAFKMIAENGIVAEDNPLFLVNAILKEDLSDESAFGLNISENMSRKELSPVDCASALDTAITFHGYSNKDAAALFGKSAGWASQTLALLKLPESIRKKIHAGKLSASAGYELAQLTETPAEFEAALARIEAAGDGSVTRSDMRAAVRDIADPDAISADPNVSTGDTVQADEKEGKGKKKTAAKPLTLKEVRNLIFDRVAEIEQGLPENADYWGDQWEVLNALGRAIDGRLKTKALWKKWDELVSNTPILKMEKVG